MDREAKLPVPPANPRVINRPKAKLRNNASSSSSSFYSTSPPDFLRQFQAACKRYRPLGTKQPTSIKPKRMVVPQKEISSSDHLMEEAKRSQEVDSSIQGHVVKDTVAQTKTTLNLIGETREDVSITPLSNLGTMTKSIGQSYINPLRDGPKLTSSCHDINLMPLHTGSQHNDKQKKVQFSIRSDKTSEGALDQMATGLDNLSSHMGSLALTEMDWSVANQGELYTIINNEPRQQNFQNLESDMNLRIEGGTSFLAKGAPATQDQMHHFKNFLSQPYTQSSVVGPSYATTTFVHSTSAPLCNSGTYCPHMLRDGDFNVNTQSEIHRKNVQPLPSSQKDISRLVVNKTDTVAKPDDSTIDTQTGVKEYDIYQEQKGSSPKETKAAENYSVLDNKSNAGTGYVTDVSTIQSQDHLPKISTSDVKVNVSKSEKLEKVWK